MACAEGSPSTTVENYGVMYLVGQPPISVEKKGESEGGKKHRKNAGPNKFLGSPEDGGWTQGNWTWGLFQWQKKSQLLVPPPREFI